MNTIAITGNTYPVKDSLRELGGRWNPLAKAWMVPAEKEAEARKIMADAPAPRRSARGTGRAGSRSRSRGTWTGCRCGSVEEYEKPGDCWTCKHDR